MKKTTAWFIVFVAIAAACVDEPDCFQLNNYIIGVSFKKLEDSSADTVAISALGTVEPPLLFYGDTTLSRFYLPLNYFADEITFFVDTEDTTRLLHLSYVSQAQFVSENCGEKFVLSGLRVEESTFDSVRLVLDIPTQNAGPFHIEIYQ